MESDLKYQSQPIAGDECPQCTPDHLTKSESIIGLSDLEEDEEVDTFDNKEEIIKNLFFKLDKGGDGKVQLEEFSNYINLKSKTPLGKERTVALFNEISKENPEDGITFQGLMDFFEREKVMEEKEDAALQPINLTVTASNISGMTVDDFLALQHTLNAIKEKSTSKLMLKEFATQEANDLDPEANIRKRWQPFASFKRRVGRKTVMKSNHGILRDILPGEYSLEDLAKFDDLDEIKPVMTIVRAKWKNNVLEVDPEFDGVIATDIATPETVNYYGATLNIGIKNLKNIKLKDRHVFQNFTYSDTYLEDYVLSPDGAGGAGIEFHDFSHVDIPMDSMEKTGHFLLAKWSDQEANLLELTGFKVPRKTALFLPGGVIHSNNYLRGTWRTMLADGHVNEAKITKEGGQQFHFKFNAL